MWQCVVISDTLNSQSEAIKESVLRAGLNSICLYADEISARISIGGRSIMINNKKVAPGAVIFYSQFNHEFSPFPLINKSNDFTIFQDQYAKQEQLKSHLLSLGNASSHNIENTLNNPFRTCDYYTSLFAYELLKGSGIKTIEPVFTNNLKDFNKCAISGHDSFYWSYIIPNSPIKVIRKGNLAGLFDAVKDLPVLIFPYEEGLYLRMWFFRDKPIIGMNLVPPAYNGRFNGLEKYNYFLPHPAMTELGENLYKATALDFYEVKAIVNRDSGQIRIINIDADPFYMSIDDGLGSFITRELTGHIRVEIREKRGERREKREEIRDKTSELSALSSDLSASSSDLSALSTERTSTLLTRMLETQLIINRSEGVS